MSNISPVRQIIQQESLNAAAAASSSTVQLMGSTIQHHNYFLVQNFQFSANGPYGQTPAQVPDIKVDACYGIPKNCIITGYSFINHIAGSTGNLEIDLVRIPTVGVASSIFTTKPVIPFSAGNFARIQETIVPAAVTNFQSAGTTPAVFSSTNLFAGEFIYLNITSKQTGGENFDFILYTIAVN